MAELYQQAFSALNVPYTILLVMVVFYWLLVIIGLLDMDTFDLDVGTDVDIDLGAPDLDANLDGDLDANVDLAPHGAGAFSVLGFLNVGEVPIMLYMTIVALCMWVNSLKMNEWWNPDGNWWFALALAVPNLLFAVVVAKILLEPVKLYRRHRQHKSSIVGKVCVVKSLEVNDKFGRCEVATDSAPIIVNARTENGEVLEQGDPAMIVRHLPEEGFHVVTKHNWE